MTSSLLVQELTYHKDSSARFAAVSPQPWSMWLDSTNFASPLGRYDIIVATPLETLVTRGAETTISPRDGIQQISLDDPFELLKHALSAHQRDNPTGLPFIGGALGYFAYDLARRFEQLPTLADDDLQLPEMAIGIYEWSYIADHHAERSWLVGWGETLSTLHWTQLCETFENAVHLERLAPLHTLEQPHSKIDIECYSKAFSHIQHYIHEGDCYQINYARRFTGRVEGDPLAGYMRLRELNSAPFSAYLNFPFAQVLSASPERYLLVHDKRVTTRPIKGTSARSADTAKDHDLAEALRMSPKDRAENLMIVDLLRNDLSRTCTPGSIKVPELFAIESFATVHHLVSTITGTLRSDKGALDLLRGAFPGGSITGAPKLRAMQIIEELEPFRRGIYCGAIGYIGVDGNMDTNIAIRTMLHRDGEIFFWAGGGIVVDSEMESEFIETEHKAAGLMRLFT